MIEVEKLFQLLNTNHTEIQMDRFITIKSGLTPYGCLFQSLRELHTRKQSLQGHYIALAKLKRDVPEKKLEQLENNLIIEESERQLKAIEREFIRFYCQSVTLYTRLGFDKIHPSQSELDRLEEERWEHRILADIAISIMSTGNVSGSLISLVQCLPKLMRQRIYSKCFGNESERQDKLVSLVNWFMEYEFDIPEPITLSQTETESLLLCCELSHLQKQSLNLSQTDASLSPKISIKRD